MKNIDNNCDNYSEEELFSLIIPKEPPKKPSQSIDKITNKVYLGDIPGSLNTDYFKSENINYVLSISLGGPLFSPSYKPELKLKHKIIDMSDEPTSNIIQYFKECILFIEESDKIYIHCSAGISRSPTIVIAYLMWKVRVSFDQAFKYVKKIRHYINPNEGFIAQLKEFDKLLNNKDYNLMEIDFSKIKWQK